jgi:hypothetical protein
MRRRLPRRRLPRHVAGSQNHLHLFPRHQHNIPTLHRSTLTSLLYDESYQISPLSISLHFYLSLTCRRSSSLSHTGNGVSRRRAEEGTTSSLYRPEHSLRDSTEAPDVAWFRMQSQQDPEGPPVTDQSERLSQPPSVASPTPDGPCTTEQGQTYPGQFNTILPELAQGRTPEGYEICRVVSQEHSNGAPASNPHAINTSGQHSHPRNRATDSPSATLPLLSQAEPQTVSSGPTVAGPSTMTTAESADPHVPRDDERSTQPSKIQPSTNPTSHSNIPLTMIQYITQPPQPAWNSPSLAGISIDDRARHFTTLFTRPDATPQQRETWNDPILADLHPNSRAMYLAMTSACPDAAPPHHPLWNHPFLAQLPYRRRAFAIAADMTSYLLQREWEQDDLRNAAEQRCAPWPIRYGDVYDKLNEFMISYRVDELLRPYLGERRDFVRMTDRMLLQAPQARAIAFLDTTAMDKEIVHRTQSKLRRQGCRCDRLERETTDTEDGEAPVRWTRSIHEPLHTFQARRREYEPLIDPVSLSAPGMTFG